MAYLGHKELLGRTWMDHRYYLYSLVIMGSTCQYVPKHFFLGEKGLGFAMTYMSPGTLQGVLAFAALAIGVSLVFILQANDWARVSAPARHYFSTYIIQHISTRILLSILSWI